VGGEGEGLGGSPFDVGEDFHQEKRNSRELNVNRKTYGPILETVLINLAQ